MAPAALKGGVIIRGAREKGPWQNARGLDCDLGRVGELSPS